MCCVPGSRYDELIRHANDGSALWFALPATGFRISPVYDYYSVLEHIAGKKPVSVGEHMFLSERV